MSIKLSIGTAVYNVRELFLRVHIESIIKQLTDETEFLLIDDCSTDKSGEICKEYAASDSRVRYIKMEENGGLSRVRNRTISEAVGKWIFFADGDDILSNHFVETALSFYNSDCDIIIHDREIFSGEKADSNEPCTVSTLVDVPDWAGREISLSCLCLKPIDLNKCHLGKETFYHAAWGALYRRDYLLDHALEFPAGQKKAQDSVFNTYAYFKAEKIAYLPYTMYYYRKDMQGITQRYSADYTEMIRSLIKHHYKCMEQLYPDNTEVEKIYRSNRLMTFVLDGMKLNFFHKDNKNPRGVRKKDFIEFVSSEPFKSAIEDFDINDCNWWGWSVPIALAKKKNFALLDILFKHPIIFRLYGGVSSRLKKIF